MKQRLQKRRREMSKVIYISEESDDWDDDSIVLQVNGAGAKPFMMEGLMCGKKFQAIIDTGLPVSIFTIEELERIIDKYWVVVAKMIDDERYMSPAAVGIYVLQYPSGKNENVEGESACCEERSKINCRS